MILEVSSKAIEDAAHCRHGFRCLSSKWDGLCKVEDPLGPGASLSVAPHNGSELCPYQLAFDSTYLCLCPIRNELHYRHGV